MKEHEDIQGDDSSIHFVLFTSLQVTCPAVIMAEANRWIWMIIRAFTFYVIWFYFLILYR